MSYIIRPWLVVNCIIWICFTGIFIECVITTLTGQSIKYRRASNAKVVIVINVNVGLPAPLIISQAQSHLPWWVRGAGRPWSSTRYWVSVLYYPSFAYWEGSESRASEINNNMKWSLNWNLTLKYTGNYSNFSYFYPWKASLNR